MKLEEGPFGFNLPDMLKGKGVQQHILRVLYQDDIFLADDHTDKKRLVNISGQEATDIGFNFSTGNSGIMVFNYTSSDATSSPQVELRRVKGYKYLEVWVNKGDNYISTHEIDLGVGEDATKL